MSKSFSGNSRLKAFD